MTKDHVSVGSEGSSPFSRTQRKESGLFSFERGSDFCFVEKNLKKDFKKLLTATSRYAIIICVPSTRHADVAELAYAHDSGSCEHYARAGSSPAICTINRIAERLSGFLLYRKLRRISYKAKSAPRGSHCGGTEFVASRLAAGGESCAAGFYFYILKNFSTYLNWS